MPRLAIEINISGSATTRISGSYDSTKWSLGTIINQYSSSDGIVIGPNPIAVATPYNEVQSMAARFPWVVQFSNTVDWVFLTETGAGPTERVFLYEYDKVNSKYTWKGFITCTLNTAATHIVRGFAVQRYLHSNGTVSVSGSVVTGSSTTFVTDRIGAGSRIAFGTTDPTSVSSASWFQISIIGTDLTLNLSGSAATQSNIPYVIDELRPMWATTNSTAANGGLFVTKGVNFNNFGTTGSTVPAAAGTQDNLKACYWMADANVMTNTASAGLSVDSLVNFQTQSAYIIDVGSSLATPRLYSYNVRASGSITAGKFTALNVTKDSFATAQLLVGGNISQLGNTSIATAAHGPGSGSKSLYFVTTTRFYRAVVSNFVPGSPNWIAESRTEVPPGNINTYAATVALSDIEYDSVTDRFIILSTGAAGVRNYYTVYPDSSGNQYTHIFGLNTTQQDTGSAEASSSVFHFNGGLQTLTCDSLNGITHIIKHGTGPGNNQMYALPLGAHWTYAASSNQRAISPSITIPNGGKFVRLFVNSVEYVGNSGEIGQIPTEPYRVYYRTTGITDNTGRWTPLRKNYDLTSALGTTTIQFMFEFKTVGNGFLIPEAISGFAVIYDDLSTDVHYQPSVINSSRATKAFAWRHSTAFGSTVPTLRVRLFDAVNANVLVDDTSLTSGSGVWAKSVDSGSTWQTFDNVDKANNATYIRYIPNTLADGLSVRGLLTQN